MSIRSLTFQVVAMVAIPAFATYHEATEYNFTFSSFAREGEISLRTEGEASGGAYHLSDELQEGAIYTPLFDRAIDVTPLVGQLSGSQTVRPIAYIPQDLHLTSISIVTPSETAPENLILSFEGRTETHTLRLTSSETPETITLHGTVQGAAGTRTGVVHTYTVTEGDSIVLNARANAGIEHPPFIVRFQSSDEPGQAQNRNVYLLDGRPFLRIAGTAKLQHHIFTLNEGPSAGHTYPESLSALLAGDTSAHTFVDDPNTVIVVEFEENGGSVTLDRDILDSPIIFGSSVESDLAHIHFPGTAKLEGPITFRDGAKQGGISVYGPDATANVSHWDPTALLLRCDVALCTPLPPIEGNWFLTHSTTIPAGRTFRIAFPSTVTTADSLPNLDFADATSRLELASVNGGAPLPDKYFNLLASQSGTLVLDRDVTYSSNLMLRAKAPGLNTTIIQKSGTFSCRNFYVLPSEDDANTFESFTFLQEGGTFEVTGQSFIVEATQKRIQVGPTEGEGTATMTLAAAPTLFEEGSNTVIDVNKGGTLALNAGLPAGTEGTTATLDLTVKGTLNLGADLNMLPALRRELRLEDGTIASAGATPVSVNCKDGTAAEADDFVIVSGGGTLKGSLTVDGISGISSDTNPLIIEANATVKDLRDFAGTVSGAGRLEAIEGTLGDVTLGDTWLANATGKKLGDVLTGWTENGTRYPGAADFAGTIGFTAGEGAQKTLDFSNLDELTSLGMAFRINNHQHVIMRLDQYADAVIRWPDNPDGITLTLIESGAYGGELTLPHFPHTEGEETGVTFEFAYFDPAAPLGYTVRQDGYSHGHSEDGVNDTLVWDNPVFTGEGAWIDIEFNGNTHNTGWFTLWDQNHKNEANGLLRGDGTDSSFADENGNVDENGDPRNNIMDNPANFTAVAHPADAQGGLALQYRPYVSFGSLDYPEEWSVAVRLTAPNQGNICLLALGNNTLVNANTTGTVNSIVFATGKSADEIVCYRFTGTSASATGAIEELFRVTLPDIQDTAHIFSVVCEGRELRLYMDGAWLNATTLPPGWNLGCGLQVGAQLGAEGTAGNPNSGVDPGFWNRALPADKDTSGGVIDYLRFYKGVLTDVAMVEMADRTPAVRENLRYVRYVPISTDPRGTLTAPDGGETWRQTDAWVEETWNGSAWTATGDTTDEPAEGAYIRLLVAEGDHALQVNVERRDAAYFYSTDRNYAALVVEPQEGNAAAGTVRLIPYGVNTTGWTQTDDELTQAIDDAVTGSAWYTTTAASTAANRTGFQYGKLRFTGGAYDPITEGDPTSTNFYGSAYLLCGTAVTEAVGTITWNGEVERSGFGLGDNNGTFTQTGTRERTYTYSAGRAVSLIFDGGVCAFSKYADVVLPAVTTGTQTVTETWQRTGASTRSWSFWDGYTYEDDTEGAAESLQSIGTPTGELTGREQVNTLQAVAGMALTRGESAEVTEWQLSGPVLAEGTVTDDTVRGNPNAGSDQHSLDVWTVGFGASSTWKFFDDTRIEAHGGAANAHGALGAGLTGETVVRGGLFARGVQTPGRLYLDFTATNGPATYQTTQAFSQQAWYRYGYEANQDTTTEAGMPPEKASPEDYKQAVAFQIRLSSKTGDVTLTLDKVPKARVQTFYVEEEAGATKALTLKLTRAKGVDPLVIWDTVVAAARLDVSNNNTGVATATSWEGNALNLRPAEGIRTPVHRGNATHGHGAYIVGATLVDWDFGAASSVPRLEVIPGAELTFTVGQDFRRQDIGGITLVAQGKAESTFPVEGNDAGPTAADLASAAWIHHRSAEPFLGQDVELGEGAIFGFHADAAASEADTQNEGVVLAGELRLTGNATLRADFESASGGAGAARLPHFVAAGGIRAMKPGLTLIVDAPTHQSADGQGGTVDWHCHTATLTGEEDFRLWKTGPGTVTFYASEPPSVTGKVTVEEGILAVTTASDTPIGAKGLHVKAGATLADNGRMTGTTRRLARIPDGQILSGGGTVKGILRLDSGATYLAKQGEALTADGISVDASLEADITIDLPTGYAAGTPYLVANREERNVRARFLPVKETARWDSIAWIDTAVDTSKTTTYAARPPQVPAPTDYDGYVEGESDTTIKGTIETPLVEQYRNAGHAYIGSTLGRTRAGTHALNPTELSDALLCFTNISAFVEDVGVDGTREYVDGTNFYVAYEFGISRQALVEIDGIEYVVLEVSVESVFDDGVSFPNVTFTEAQKAFVADFNNSTVLSFDLIDANGTASPLTGIAVEEVTGMDGTPVTPGKRWFRIPYQDLLKQTKDGNIRLRATATSPYAKRP